MTSLTMPIHCMHASVSGYTMTGLLLQQLLLKLLLLKLLLLKLLLLRSAGVRQLHLPRWLQASSTSTVSPKGHRCLLWLALLLLLMLHGRLLRLQLRLPLCHEMLRLLLLLL